MTAFPWNTNADERDEVAPAGEPSHVHIPRPSRQRTTEDLVDLSFKEVAQRRSCADD